MAIALLCLAIVPVPAVGEAANSSQTLTITGAGNTSVAFEVTRRTVLNVADFAAKTQGTYAGFGIYREQDRQFIATSVYVPSWEATGQPIGTKSYSRDVVKLAAGVYRIYLLGDAQTSVKIPILRGLTSRTISTIEPVNVSAEALDLASSPPAMLTETKITVDVPPASIAFLMATAVVEHHQAGFIQTCIADPGVTDCQGGGAIPSNTVVFPSPGSVGTGYVGSWGSGRPSPGPKDVVMRMAGVAKADHLLGFYLILPLR